MAFDKLTDSKQRIFELMEYFNVKPADVCKRAKILPSSMSNYLNGNRVPRQDQIAKIADAFYVNPAWLMGYNVGMFETVKNADYSINLDNGDNVLMEIKKLNSLDPTQQKIVFQLIDSLYQNTTK